MPGNCSENKRAATHRGKIRSSERLELFKRLLIKVIFDIRMQCRLEYIRMNNHFGLVKVYVFTERCILFIYLFIFEFTKSR